MKTDRFIKLMRLVTRSATILSLCLFVPTMGVADVVLWNRLGSVDQVLNSEVGPGGAFTGDDHAFEPAQFDDGYVRKVRGSYITFPSEVTDGLRERGTIELWVNSKVSNPVPFQYGFFALIGTQNAPYPSERGRVWLIWGDGGAGRGFVGGVNFSNTVNGQISAITPNEPNQFIAIPGVPFHAAIAWDINGIEGTSDRVRVYRDGEIVGRTTSAWIIDGSRQQPIYLGQSPDAGGFDKFIVDNLIIHDFAKT